MDSTNKMAVLVVSCDEYSDLWNDFFNLFEKYWPDLPYKFYLANNTKKYSRKNLEVINCGEGAQWSSRVRTALNVIEEKYICMLLEDLFLSDFVNTKELDSAINIMEQNKLFYYKLFTFSKIKTSTYKNIPYLQTIPSTLEYGVSLQASIWEKQFLLDLVGTDDYNAWKFEANFHKDATDIIDYSKCVYDNRDLLHICHGVVQGCFLPSAIRKLKKIGYDLDLSQREILPTKDLFIRNLKIIANNIFKGRLKTTVKNIAKYFGIKSVLDSNK